MKEPTSEFSSAAENVAEHVEAACAEIVVAFAQYVAANWKMTEQEWMRIYDEPPPTGSYFDGFNAAIDQMADAAALFTGTW